MALIGVELYSPEVVDHLAKQAYTPVNNVFLFLPVLQDSLERKARIFVSEMPAWSDALTL